MKDESKQADRMDLNAAIARAIEKHERLRQEREEKKPAETSSDDMREEIGVRDRYEELWR